MTRGLHISYNVNSLFNTLINLLGDAVTFVKQSASCVSLVHQFTELIFF